MILRRFFEFTSLTPTDWKGVEYKARFANVKKQLKQELKRDANWHKRRLKGKMIFKPLYVSKYSYEGMAKHIAVLK